MMVAENKRLFALDGNLEQEFIDFINNFPKEILALDGLDTLDPFSLAKAYFDAEEVVEMTIDPNANVNGKSPVNFNSEIFKPQLKLRAYHLLWKNLSKRYGTGEAFTIIRSVITGELYFHDVSKTDLPYCYAPDTLKILGEGRPYGWLPSAPPNKMRSYMGQLREVTMDYSQHNAGAIGLANALVNLAYFTRKERESKRNAVMTMIHNNVPWTEIINVLAYLSAESEEKYEKYVKYAREHYVEENGAILTARLTAFVDWLYDREIEDEIQQTVHIFHNTFRIGGDSPFTNISLFDTEIIKDTFASVWYPDGSDVVDNIEEIMRVQKIYAEFFAKGSPVTGKPYRFPVTTVNIKLDEHGKVIDTDFFYYMADLNRERGVFNFHSGEKIASCCRLTSDLASLKDTVRMDSFGNGGMSIGSHRVVAINLHRCALNAKANGLSFWGEVLSQLHAATKLLIVHKEDILRRRVESGVLKFFNIKWAHLSMFFSTFGFTGLYDAYEVLYGDYNKQDYIKFAKHTLRLMEDYAKAAGRENKGFAFNVEEIPGENASPKMAKKDNIIFGTNKELLSNQMIPLYVDADLFERLEVSGELMNMVSGGAILHLNVADEMTVGANREIHRRIIEDYKIPHFAINKGFSTCVNGHTTVGVVENCHCGAKIDTYTTRVVGFFTDTKDWVKARRAYEFPRRRWYGEGEFSQ